MPLTLERPAFHVEPLSPVLGAAVTGLDLRQPLPQDTQRAVYDAFIRYHVLCFRDQHLSEEEQVAFTEQFGTLERHVASNRGLSNPLVHIVTNLGADGKPSGKVASTQWHSDKSFRPQPSLATILHALVMPPEGGETCFANMVAAYEAALTKNQDAMVDASGNLSEACLACHRAYRREPTPGDKTQRCMPRSPPAPR